MIIWSGKGYYVLLVGICCHVLVMMGCKTMLADPSIYQTHGWPKAAAFLLAAAILWLLGKSIARRTAYGIDSATGERVAYRPRDTLFFIPIPYWSVIFVVLAVYVGLFNPQ
jgi:hypothetical protein